MFLLDVLSEPVWQRLTWTLLHFLWQGLAVAAVVATLLYVWPVRRADHRYLFHLAALVAMAACPLVTFMAIDVPESAAVVSREAEIEAPLPLAPDAGPGFVATETPVGPAEPATGEAQLPVECSETAISDVEDSANLPVPVTWEARLRQYIDAIQPYALVVWIGGVLLLAMRLSLGWLHVRWLAWGRRVIPADLAAKAATLGKRLGLRFPPRVCVSDKIREAIVVGLWRPLVLLPASWLTEMTPEVLEAVIAHELAHVRRLDLWVNLLQRLMETLLFYHPAVWWLSRRVGLEREMCTDELAVGATSERLVYAIALEQLGRMRLGQTTPQFGAGIGGDKMVLLNRVGNILGLSSSSKRARWWPVALLALAVPAAIWAASASIVSPTENETRAEEGAPSTSEKLGKADVKRWVEKANSPVQSEFDAAVEALVAMGPEVAQEMIPLLKTGRTDRLGLKVLETLASEPSVQRILVNAIEEARERRHPNVVHCGLIALGKSGNVAHADFIAAFLKTNDIAAISALATLGGEQARDHLIGAFDIVPTERWFMLAGALGRLGDSAAVPELKRRLAQVELPPNDRFPPATVAAMTGAISALSDEKETFTTTEYCQGQHFRYPFAGPGAPKTFSVNPLRNHYVRLPNVDPESKAGREAIWRAMEGATEGPGFTIDENEVVAFHGLKLAPLWPDGRPYPTTLYDWLRQTSHQVLRNLIDQEKQTGRCAIPKSGLLAALDPAGRLYVLALNRTSNRFTYNVTVMPQDPSMQLIPVGEDAEETQLTRIAGCTLYDLESETKDGSLNLSRAHLETMTPEKWQGMRTDAVLVAEFAENGIALAVPGADQFLLVEAGGDWEKPEKVLALLRVAAKKEATTPGQKIIKRDSAIFHVFSKLRKGQKFAFAVRMPDGDPVAGVLEVHTVDWKAETLGIRDRFLPTAAARDVFATADAHAADASAEGNPVEIDVPAREAEPSRGSERLTIDLILAAGNLRGTPSFWIGYEQLGKDALRERATQLIEASPELGVVVRADRAMPHKHVAELLDLLKAVGAKEVSVAVFPLKSVLAIHPGPGRDGTIRGKVIGPDTRGGPVDYFVTLTHEAWANRFGLDPGLEVEAGETFEFRNVPAGKCTLRARPGTASGENIDLAARNVEIEVVVKSKQVVEVELSFDQSRASSAWGEAVDGVQLRLRCDRPRWHVDETIAWKIDVRNTGKRHLRFTPQAQETVQIEVDGRVFNFPPSLGTVNSYELKPGQETTIDFGRWQLKDRPFQLGPGKHTVKITLSVFPAEGEKGGVLQVTSHPVAITIERALPGSRLSIDKAIEGEVAFAAVCEAVARSRLTTTPSPRIDPYNTRSQDFKVVEVLFGKAEAVERINLVCKVYGEERAIGDRERVIWIGHTRNMGLHGGLSVLKALPDTPENRQAVKEAAGSKAAGGKVVERTWSDATIEFTLRVIEGTAKTPCVAEIVITNKTDRTQSVPTPYVMPLCGDTNKNNIRVFDKEKNPLKMRGIHRDGPSRPSTELPAKASKTWRFELEKWFADMADPGTYQVEPWYFSDDARWSSWVGRVKMQPLTVVRKEPLDPPWGKPVDGVSVRLTKAIVHRQPPDQSLARLLLRYDARNNGSRILHLPKNGLRHQVEVDGQWYEWVDPRLVARDSAEAVSSLGVSALLDFEPGRCHRDGLVNVAGNWRAIPKGKEKEYAARQYSDLNPVNVKDDYGKELVLAPGKHRVRVAVACPSARAPFRGIVRAASETVEVEVVAAPETKVARPVDADKAPADVSITGRVIGIDGKPAVGYRVTALPEAWRAYWGDMPSTTTDEQGAFSFRTLPDGPCDVSVTSNPKTNQPNVRIKGVILKKGHPVNVTLSLEQKYSFGGQFTDAAGKAQPNRNMLAIWKDPTSGAKYSSNTKTDAKGRYRFASPFEVAERVLINDGGMKDTPEHQKVKHGRENVDFQLKTNKDRN